MNSNTRFPTSIEQWRCWEFSESGLGGRAGVCLRTTKKNTKAGILGGIAWQQQLHATSRLA
jgi:hypothetical protein